MDIGKSIRVALAQKNIRRSDLAGKLGCVRSNVTQMCTTGKVRSETLKRLAEIFEMSVSDFIKLGED
jgi:DNA-binding Xre family transcriptional regulator